MKTIIKLLILLITLPIMGQYSAAVTSGGNYFYNDGFSSKAGLSAALKFKAMNIWVDKSCGCKDKEGLAGLFVRLSANNVDSFTKCSECAYNYSVYTVHGGISINATKLLGSNNSNFHINTDLGAGVTSFDSNINKYQNSFSLMGGLDFNYRIFNKLFIVAEYAAIYNVNQDFFLGNETYRGNIKAVLNQFQIGFKITN